MVWFEDIKHVVHVCRSSVLYGCGKKEMREGVGEMGERVNYLVALPILVKNLKQVRLSG